MKQKNAKNAGLYPEFDGLNLSEIDKQIIKIWADNDVFNKSMDEKEGNPTFVFYEGPPSANGMPGIHHVIGRTVKDIFCRYKTMQGFQVKRKGGWDTHGLPVELKVEKELGITKEDIGTKISIEDYNKECRKTVLQFKSVWDDLTNKMGYWVDLENPYITYENDYIESVWWGINELFKKNLLYKGYTIQPFSPAAGTGLSTHELNQPGAYQDVTDTSAVAQFRVIKDAKSSVLFDLGIESAHFIAWTTTPWTLPSNTALAVGKKVDYVLVKSFNPYTFLPVNLILAKALIGKWFKAENENGNFEAYENGSKSIPWQILKEFKGSDLEGINYEQLLPYFQPEDGDAFRVILGDFVTTEDGTGIVHLAPSFGADDMRVAKAAGIGSLTLVDKQGKFIDGVGEFAGRYVKDYKEEENYRSVDIDISIKLKEENKAFNVQKYVHSYPHCWRTDKPVLYYPLDSWFIETTAVKKDLIANNNLINWKPKSTGSGRFGNWLENLQDWNLSRSRFWGIPLPIWRTEDGEEVICIGSVAQLNAEMEKANQALDLKNEPLEDLHKPYIDRVVLVSPSGKAMKRETDVIDVWFDSGSMPFAQQHYPFAPNPKGELLSSPKYQTARKSIYPLLKELKEKKVNEETLEEKILWDKLRNKNLNGFKFRRQHIIDMFIVDFVCLSKGLIVEVDGAYHNLPEQLENDLERTTILESLGFKVIRFTNNEVVNEIDKVLEKIETTLNQLNDFKYENPDLNEEHPPMGLGAFPADFIAEGVDQTRGWFFTLHAISTMLFNKPAYKNVIANGLVLDGEGQKMSKRKGNVVDPFTTLDKFGADATRWYIISNSQPWDNLKFSINGIDEVRRKLFGTLYNTYSFFSLYANIDGFAYQEKEVPLEDRQEIDQWIISVLNTLIKDVNTAYGDYEPTNAARLIQEFVDSNLSNWYVRLNRRRFWKGEYSQDKVMAYQTLYTCLETLTLLMAPIAPFFSDFLFQNLNSVSQKTTAISVHLADFPKVNKAFIDEDLEERMRLAQTISSLVLSLRKKEKIKVRQPLAKIIIPIIEDSLQGKVEKVESYILNEINVKEIEYLKDTSGIINKSIKPNFKTLGPKYGKYMKAISTVVKTFGQDEIATIEKQASYILEVEGEKLELNIEDFEIKSDDIEGWLVASDKGVTVALDIHITEKLAAEGNAREFINKVQNLRKDNDFEVTDKIFIQMLKSEEFNPALNQFKNYICEEILAKDIEIVDSIENGIEIEVNNMVLSIHIHKN